MTEILGELSNLCKEQSIEILDLESFRCIQRNNNIREDRSRSKEDIKIKEGIDLRTKRETEGMIFFSY